MTQVGLRCSGLVAGGCPLHLNTDYVSSAATDGDQCALPQLNKQIKERVTKMNNANERDV